MDHAGEADSSDSNNGDSIGEDIEFKNIDVEHNNYSIQFLVQVTVQLLRICSTDSQAAGLL